MYLSLNDPGTVIGFGDMQDLWQDFVVIKHAKQLAVQEAYLRKSARESREDKLLRVVPVGEWGRRLGAIWNALQKGSAQAWKRTERLTNVASLCWTIFCTVRFGVEQSDMSWEDEGAKVWQDQSACPAVINKKLVPKEHKGGVALGGNCLARPTSTPMLSWASSIG